MKTDCLMKIKFKLPKIPIRERLRQEERWLINYFKTPYPVNVRVEKFGKNSETIGECYKNKKSKRITIRLDKALPEDDLVEYLLHEWAHAIVHPDVDHSDNWGKAYAKLYRKWHDEGGEIESALNFHGK